MFTLHPSPFTVKKMYAVNGQRSSAKRSVASPKGAVNGLTLIELLVAISIATMIAGVALLFLKNGMEAWRFSREHLELNRQAEKIMEILSDGGYRTRGIRDALEIVSAGPTAIRIVPIWRDTSHRYIIKNEFKLNKPYKKDTPIPIALVKRRGLDEYLPADIKFYEQANTVKFMDRIPADSELMFMYHPDPADDDVIMGFDWDPASQNLRRSYNKKTLDLPPSEKDIRLTNFAFTYFDNLGEELKIPEGHDGLSKYQMKAVASVKAAFTLKKGGYSFDAVSVIALRNRKGTERGVSLQKGSIVRLPNSHNIVSLSIDNIEGVRPGGRLEVRIKGDTGKTWGLKLYLGKEGKIEEIKRYEVEYPKGAVAYSSDKAIRLNVGFQAGKGIDLLSLDDTGNYDYDDDANLEDIVNFDDRRVTLEVSRMDCERAVLFVRP